jgi:hypothetical protein
VHSLHHCKDAIKVLAIKMYMFSWVLSPSKKRNFLELAFLWPYLDHSTIAKRIEKRFYTRETLRSITYKDYTIG